MVLTGLKLRGQRRDLVRARVREYDGLVGHGDNIAYFRSRFLHRRHPGRVSFEVVSKLR